MHKLMFGSVTTNHYNIVSYKYKTFNIQSKLKGQGYSDFTPYRFNENNSTRGDVMLCKVQTAVFYS